jgi:NAD(P)-dependent dehydrogenase (short-subunit alcohol dehydrogenase family)
MGKLQGKVAVITGGTQGIGFATAKLFVAEGAYVFITGRRQKELEEAVVSIGSNVTGVQGDVTNLADLDRLYDSVKAKGRIDVLFANVGLGGFVPLGSITEEYYDQTFDTNVKGLLFTVQKALPFLNDGASIILTGSAAAAKGTPSFGVYAARKAAIRSFVRTWTTELKDRRVRSNVLSPGPVVTPQAALQPPEAIARIVSTVPMGRMVEPEEIAKAALFLASDDSSFVTGIELFADGGRAQVLLLLIRGNVQIGGRNVGSVHSRQHRGEFMTGHGGPSSSNTRSYAMSNTLKLYHATNSPNSRRVRIFLAEKGLTPKSLEHRSTRPSA